MLSAINSSSVSTIHQPNKSSDMICDADTFINHLITAINSINSNEIFIVCNMNFDDIAILNTKFGYAVISETIGKIESNLCNFIGHHGKIARSRGGEYLLLLRPIRSLDNVVPLLRALRDIVTCQSKTHDRQIRITASIGCSIYPIEGNHAQLLLRNATQAMYSAKVGGKNKYMIFDSESAHIAAKEIQKEVLLEQAILNHELIFHYQPKIDLHTGKIHGFEALVRWDHPKGIRYPADFLPSEYKDGVGYQLGLWAIESAMAQLQQWIDSGLVMPVSVNLSARQFLNSNFMTDIKRLQETFLGVSPELIEFEILESEAIENIDELRQVIESLQSEGFKFSLDDFGTGYSSLLHLKVIPAQYVKIDKAFVIGITKNPKDLALLQMMVELSQRFNYEIVAEGVETLEHGLILKRIGCRFIQGYFIAKPLPANRVLEWIENYIPNESFLPVN